MSSLVLSMWRAVLLDEDLYEDVESDPHRIWQALFIVICVSIAGGLGVGWPQPGNIILSALIFFAGWIGWAVVSTWLGTRLFPEPATETNLMEMIRTIGFAATPGLLMPLALLVPEARLSVFSMALVWMLAATVMAVRAALDYVSMGRALMVCAIGWVMQVGAVLLALYLLVATSAPLV